MQAGPHVEICPFAIQFFGTYVIVMGVNSPAGKRLSSPMNPLIMDI